MALIERKKNIYPVGDDLRGYLGRHDRLRSVPASFAALSRHNESVPVYDRHGNDTLWQTVLYPPAEREEIYEAAVRTYAALKVHGRMSLMKHLVTDRVDLCTWGNTQPFRVRILNTLNENFDYFYVKKADASRIYGIELEHILSPNRIDFLCDGETVIEEHIAGIPGKDFIDNWLSDTHLDQIRLAKEFVKFNERCFVRLLGDMHSGNYVVDLTPDFDETHYRLRAIDFDQQSYEGHHRVYRPQYYPQNNPIVFLGMKCMSPPTYEQYRQEELVLMASRARDEVTRLADLLHVMSRDRIAPLAHVHALRRDLADHYRCPSFLQCESMGDLVSVSLSLLPTS
ncbi:MAG: hypothetical protein JRH11_05535 [Deltaproteobacteria bacterium]|nr:hypothetical protein [Deltaproteobacteria bacterium]